MKNLIVSQLINDKGNGAMNQIVVEKKDKFGHIISKIFVSYGYNIIKYDIKNRKIYITENWDYSKTTRKHVCIFLRDFCNLPVYSRNDILKNISNKKLILVNKFD